MILLYLEGLRAGQRFAGTTRIRIEESRIKHFASSPSIWMKALLMHRCSTASQRVVGIPLRWPRPVRPGDELRVESEVLEVRPSRSRPGQGMVKVRTETLNQEGDIVQTSVGNLVVPRRRSS